MTKNACNESYLNDITVYPFTSTDPQQPSSFKRFFKRVVFILGSLHLTFMSALGIWLWSDPGLFGATKSCTVELVSTAIVGRYIPLGSQGLRAVSLLMYSLFLTPGLNLVMPMIVFLGPYIWYQTWRKNRSSYLENPSQHESRPKARSNTTRKLVTASGRQLGGLNARLQSIFRPPEGAVTRLFSSYKGWYCRHSTYPSILPIFVGLLMLVIINLIFILNIELTLRKNRSLQASDESEWGFGQVLAMLLLVMPLRDLLETIFERRERRWKEKNTDMLLNAIKNKEVANLENLVANATNVNVTADGDNIELLVVRHLVDITAF
jgi:hypothetical protein